MSRTRDGDFDVRVDLPKLQETTTRRETGSCVPRPDEEEVRVEKEGERDLREARRVVSKRKEVAKRKGSAYRLNQQDWQNDSSNRRLHVRATRV